MTATTDSPGPAADGGKLSSSETQETSPGIRAATSEFGTGLRSRLGADPNACW